MHERMTPPMLMQHAKDSIRYRSGQFVRAVLPERAIDVVTVLLRHRARVGVFPNIVHPKTFNEKVLHRVLFDRRPILTQLQDKYAVREYVGARLGEEVLPRLYWVTTTPWDIPFDDLPERFVVKPTHGSGWYTLVSDKRTVNRRELIETCNGWLSRSYYDVEREWVYKGIMPRILVEEYLTDGTGPNPVRYKFFVFHGRAHVIEVAVGTPSQARCGFYGRSWGKLPGFFVGWKQIEEALLRPKHLDRMIECAEILADGLDFVRVDLYDAEMGVRSGEVTTCPGGGTTRYGPSGFDRYLGGLWDLS